jgi:hypothetical protein
VAFLAPTTGTVAAGWAVGLTTFASVLDRIGTGYIAAGSTGEPWRASPALFYMGGVLFGLGVGNATSLLNLLVQQNFPKQCASMWMV